ncbi:hypothetical protein [Clostridium algidicarnis]|uniref:hypothetical protein n=1 Tax=Clostridium algidicarnis TaxID=37659 RepID=UPI001C0E7A70|nr:hypothetical protein [Clostridium algidicarnis]MBU3193656.1 hypothetical protein [Clostridium algidicarnis]
MNVANKPITNAKGDSKDSKNMSQIKTMNLYTKGSKRELTKDDYSKISQLITNKLESIGGQLRTSMSEEKIDLLKENSNVLEIIPSKYESFTYVDGSNTSYKIVYNKLFILLSHDLGISNDDNTIIITEDDNGFDVLKLRQNSTKLSEILLDKR